MDKIDFVTNSQYYQSSNKKQNLKKFFDTLDSENPSYRELDIVIPAYCSNVVHESQLNVQRILDELMPVGKKEIAPIFDNELETMFFIFPRHHADIIEALTRYHLHREKKFNQDGELIWKNKGFVWDNRWWYSSTALQGNIVEIWKDYELTFQQRQLFRKLKKTVKRRKR